ncbi:hypothetical protein J2S09_001057, partial [Bacillus fengqiuensis]|nr:hypothetical protein [Bacillus fengqiuensis]
MDLSFNIFRALHSYSWFYALFLLWIPIITKKGEKLHNTAENILLRKKFTGLNKSSRRGRLAPDLSHHRTYRSVYGGSIKFDVEI